MGQNKVPISLITGFLGSGKSTFINRLLREKSEVKFGLLLNEFGDVKLESQIVKAHDDQIVELDNGCMCCVVRTTIVEAVEHLLKTIKGIDYILVEASGLSDPNPIAQTLLAEDLMGKVRLDAVLCLVDPINFEKNTQDYHVAPQQVKGADFVLISKSDIATTDQISKTRESIRLLAPKAKTFLLNPHTPIDAILDTCGHNPEKPESSSHHHHDADIVFWKSNLPLDFEKFEKLMKSLPPTVFRAKGVVHFGNDTMKSTKHLLQIVGSRKQLIEEDWSKVPHTALVFIGKLIDKERLIAALQATLLS
jgi:G3E family GTPase